MKDNKKKSKLIIENGFRMKKKDKKKKNKKKLKQQKKKLKQQKN